MAVTWRKLAFEDDVITKAMYDAYTILAADTDNTPAALTVGASTIVGRKASGGIVAMSVSDALTLLSHALSAHSNATGVVPFNGNQAQRMAFENVADTTALSGLSTHTLGQVAFQIDTLGVYVCTVAS